MADKNNLGTIEVGTGLDFTGIRADLQIIHGLMTKQLNYQASIYGKMGDNVKSYGKTAVATNKTIASSFKDSLKSALSMERVISRLAFIGTVGLVYSLGRAIQESFSQGVKDAIAFEKALAHVNTVLDESAKYYIPIYKSGIESLSIVYGRSVTELSKSLYDIISARIEPEFALNVLNEITALAVANQAELKDVTTAVVGIMNAYNYSTLDAVDVTDKLQATVKYGRMELNDMAGVLGRVTSAAAALGISLDDVLGSLATMTRQGMNARESVTALRRMLLKLSEDAQLSAMIQRDGLLSVIPIMELMTTKQKIMFAGGIRGFNAAIIAIKNYVSQGKDVKAIMESEGEAAKALGFELDTTAQKAKELKERWQGMWREEGSQMKKAGLELQTFRNTVLAEFLIIINKIASPMPFMPGWNKAVKIQKQAFGDYNSELKETERLMKAFSFMPLDFDYSQGGSGKTYAESTSEDLAALKEELTADLKLEKSIYLNRISHGEEANKAAKDYIRTWERLNYVLSKIAEKGTGFDDFLFEFTESDTGLQNFLSTLIKVEDKISLDDKIKDINDELREEISLFKLWENLGLDVSDLMVKSFEDALKAMEDLGQAGSIAYQKLSAELDIYKNKQKEVLEETSDYEKWRDKIIDTGTDVLGFWATFANEIEGISGITATNITENWKDIYKALKEISPKIADLFLEAVDKTGEIFDTMAAMESSFISGVSSGYMSMIRDILDGANMMKTNWANYFKEMADTFIYEINRMLIQWLAFKAFTAIGGFIGGILSPTPASLPIPDTIITGIGGGNLGGSSSTINNFNPSFNPNINVGATFSQRDMAFIYKTGKGYYGKTSL